MGTLALKTETAKETPLAKIFEQLGTSEKGLTALESNKRLEAYGYNEISEKRVNPLLKFLGYFRGPFWQPMGRPDHTDHLARNRVSLGLFHYLGLPHRLGQGTSVSPL